MKKNNCIKSALADFDQLEVMVSENWTQAFALVLGEARKAIYLNNNNDFAIVLLGIAKSRECLGRQSRI